MDSTHTVLVHLKLEADSFESYICEDKLVLGVSIRIFLNSLKLLEIQIYWYYMLKRTINVYWEFVLKIVINIVLQILSCTYWI